MPSAFGGQVTKAFIRQRTGGGQFLSPDKIRFRCIEAADAQQVIAPTKAGLGRRPPAGGESPGRVEVALHYQPKWVELPTLKIVAKLGFHGGQARPESVGE